MFRGAPQINLSMKTMHRIELPPNYGVTQLGNLDGGRLVDLLSKLLDPFSVRDRLGFRALVTGPPGPIVSGRISVTSPTWLATAISRADSEVSLFNRSENGNDSAKLILASAVSALAFVGEQLLVTCTVGGDIEMWRLSTYAEAKCLYKFVCPDSVYGTNVTSEFQVILNKGKALLAFDLIAAVSGNTDESVVSPVVVDLLAAQPIMDSASSGSLIASVNPFSLTVTDMDSHAAVTIDIIPAGVRRCFWSPPEVAGHVFLVTEDGALMDAAWSNGLVGVAAVPTSGTIRNGNKPTSLQRTEISVHPSVVDINFGLVVTCIDNDLLVYSIKKSSNTQLPISPIVTEFLLEKQVPINLHSDVGEEIISALLADRKTCQVLIQDSHGEMRSVDIVV